jgi:diaminopimelate epimerase
MRIFYIYLNNRYFIPAHGVLPVDFMGVFLYNHSMTMLSTSSAVRPEFSPGQAPPMIFYKTVSSGNDFIHINMEAGTNDSLAKEELARRLCRRQTGAGADGVVYYRYKNADKRGTGFGPVDFEIFNRDGSEAELSGNGMAGLASLLFYLEENKNHTHVILNTKAGHKEIRYLHHAVNKYRLRIEIGEPDFQRRKFFPFLVKDKRRLDYSHRDITFYPVSVGNPHVVVILEAAADDEKLLRMGTLLEGAEIFPWGTNVEFVVPTTPNANTGTKTTRVIGEKGEPKQTGFRIFYYERGVGPTLSSSTGSAAVFAVLRRLRRIDEYLTIPLPCQTPGDEIKISGKRKIYIENSTEIVYKGVYLSD